MIAARKRILSVLHAGSRRTITAAIRALPSQRTARRTAHVLGVASRFRLPIAVVLAATLYGTVGYHLLEGWPLLDGLFMTVITLTTIGFGETQPLDTSGQVFTISVILLGVGSVAAAFAVVSELVASGDLARLVERSKVHRRIAHLADHYVVCGFGRVGRAAADEFRREGIPFVVVEVDPDLADTLSQQGFPYLIADPTHESVLRDAGIARARGLVCAVDSDAVNVYVTLTARALNPDLVIVSRSASPESVGALQRAGADRIVSPYSVSGARMAFLSVRPAVVDFLDLVNVDPSLRLEEVVVREPSPLAGMRLGEARALCAPATVLAMRRPGEAMRTAPPDDVALAAGDLLVVFGPIPELERMAA